jgi:hypothetical protein
MQFSAYSPQYAFGPSVAPMPMYKGGGDVKETYGLRNAAEQLRERGRGDDTILAHINPQEAGILKLLGGSGTINPYTGLPEFWSWNPVKIVQSVGKEIGRGVESVGDELYRAGSSIGKELERGVEKIAKDPILGPIAQIAVAYYGGPIGSAIYAGLAPEGSSFNTQNALRAGATTAAFNAMSAPDSNVFTPRGSITDLFGSGMQQVPVEGISSVAESAPSVLESIGGTMDAAGSANIPGGIGSLESAVNAAADQAITVPPSGIGEPLGQVASADVPFSDAARNIAPADLSAGSASDLAATPQGPIEPVYTTPTVGVRSVLPDFVNQGIDFADQGIEAAKQSIGKVIPDSARQFAREYLPTLSQVKDAATIASLGTTAYGVYQTKQELDAAKAEADRIMSDQANRKAEEVAWAQSVLRDYPYNYQRLTEEDVRRERGMAMGGRITSYDDEIGGDDNMMQGGIAALAKGGLPPRYLRGGGDGMSDSIRASIEGKQEARLADGEFVVPADVVSHLGNGSSNAGAKRLYSMMDRVRRSRTGKTRQAPEVNTRRLMPA